MKSAERVENYPLNPAYALPYVCNLHYFVFLPKHNANNLKKTYFFLFFYIYSYVFMVSLCVFVVFSRTHGRCVDCGTEVVYPYTPIKPHGVSQAK